MTTGAATTYDNIPYATRPFYACHPDCLAVMGVLLGMTPAPPTRCRVLEIGCASAGNLIPMALQFPGSQFVGLDLSPVQINAGQDVVRDLGIANLDLRAQSLTDIDESWGAFDYIICHGVFSWVPEPIREKILSVCQNHLSQHGIAYVSYNTYPGWYVRKTLRDVLHLHVKRFPDPVVRVAQAREFLEFLDKSGLPTDSPSAESLRGLIAELRTQPDYYLFHEYLETENQPFYFSDFMTLASAHGLQYMGNAWHHIDLDLLKPEAKQTLLDISEDIVQLEQFTDFLTNRPFRRSLLCRAKVPLDRVPAPAVVARLHVGALARPVSAKPDCYSNTVEAFTIDDKKRGSTDQPLTKTLFTVLAEVSPNLVPFSDLWREIRDRLAAHKCLTPELESSGDALLAQTVLQAYLGNFVSLHLEPFPFTTSPGERPRASRLARWQVMHDAPRLSNLRHNSVEVERIDRILLPFLDGSRSREQLGDVFVTRVEAGTLSFTDDAGQPLSGDRLRAAIAETIDTSIGRLAGKCLFEE